MFPELPPFAEPGRALRAALLDIGKPGGIMDAKDDLSLGPERLFTDPALSLTNRDNPFHTAGATFLGQFVGHDLTLSPALDLASLYGKGAQYADDGVSLRIESGGRFEDVPRLPDGTPLIADVRNDDNVVISGLHAAFIRFHNRLVDRQLVTWHYQWIVLHEYLPQMIGHGVTHDILTHGRRWYRPARAVVPIEFIGAAYRFGHSMVRPSYRVNRQLCGFVEDLRGGQRAPERYVDWGTFVNFGDGRVRPNKRIDRKISSPLFAHSLPQRNLVRHVTWGIPAGQDIAETMGFTPLHLPELAHYGLGLESRTPLWYYILAEAELIGDGIVLGPVGARIVGEVLIGLVDLDPRSYLRVRPDWKPAAGRLTELLRYARVDPVSRGV
jgi:hypothetical protein